MFLRMNGRGIVLYYMYLLPTRVSSPQFRQTRQYSQDGPKIEGTLCPFPSLIHLSNEGLGKQNHDNYSQFGHFVLSPNIPKTG